MHQRIFCVALLLVFLSLPAYAQQPSPHPSVVPAPELTVEAYGALRFGGWPHEHCRATGDQKEVTCKSSAPHGNTLSIHDWPMGGSGVACYVDYDINKERWNLRGLRGPCGYNKVGPNKLQIYRKH